MSDQRPGQMFVRPTDGYEVQHDPTEGRRDYVQDEGEWVARSSWYLRRLAEGVLRLVEPPKETPAAPVVHEAPPVTELSAPAAPAKVKSTRAKRGSR